MLHKTAHSSTTCLHNHNPQQINYGKCLHNRNAQQIIMVNVYTTTMRNKESMADVHTIISNFKYFRWSRELHVIEIIDNSSISMGSIKCKILQFPTCSDAIA